MSASAFPKDPFKRLGNIAYFAGMKFLIKYRRTALGPLWLIVSPALFIGLLGLLFSEIGAIPPDVFIPHLTIGLIMWSLISGCILASSTVLQRNRAQILQGNQSIVVIGATETILVFLTFLHQMLLVAFVLWYFQKPLGWVALESLLGLALVSTIGFCCMIIFGILGARYRDLQEVFNAVMRVAFLATPIIWMPGESGRGAIMEKFLLLNPFYHMIETVRAPLSGQSTPSLSLVITTAIAALAILLAYAFHRRFARFVALWV